MNHNDLHVWSRQTDHFSWTRMLCSPFHMPINKHTDFLKYIVLYILSIRCTPLLIHTYAFGDQSVRRVYYDQLTNYSC